MTVSKKLYGAVGVLLVLLIIISALAYLGQRSLINGYKSLADNDVVQKDLSMDAENELGIAVQAFKNYLLRGEEKYLKGFKEHTEKIGDDLTTYGTKVNTDEERTVLDNAKQSFDAYKNAIDPVIEARKKNKKSVDVVALDRQYSLGSAIQLRLALEEMSTSAVKSYEEEKVRLNKNAARVSLFQILLTIAAIIVGILLSTMVIRTILKSIMAVKKSADEVAIGNLTHEVSIYSSDEIGEMAKSFNRMINNIRSILSQIDTTTNSLASSSQELSSTSDDIHKGSQQLSSQTEQVVTAMTEVSQTIMDMAKNASQAADGSKNASDTAAKGKRIVDTTASDMLKIAQTVQEAATTIEELGRSSAQIGEIVAVINGIADQTNLLALNAAIEAARAGEQGRGFAVVADEVRKLAERTAQATKDITQRIAAIQTAAGESVAAMKKGSDEVDKGVGLAKEASTALDSIVTASTNAMDMVQRIAAATEQQSAASEEVSQNMEHISGIAKQSSASTEQIKVSAADLAKLAEELKEMTSFFRSAA